VCNQLEKGIQLRDKTHLVRQLLPPTAAALQLKGCMRHRYELTQESTRRKNKLTAICAEVFPEFTTVLKDPHLPTALASREKFPTPNAVATAAFSALVALRAKSRRTVGQLEQLQQLASQSSGSHEVIRQKGLVLQQGQLMRELKMLQEHIEQLETEIQQVVEQSREGQILTSLPGIGSMQAGASISAIGNILNVEHASDLKASFGWAPKEHHSGTSLDRVHLTHGGTRTMKQDALSGCCECYSTMTPKSTSLIAMERIVH
jgi:Transposase IS116/IS110/IS902 family